MTYNAVWGIYVQTFIYLFYYLFIYYLFISTSAMINKDEYFWSDFNKIWYLFWRGVNNNNNMALSTQVGVQKPQIHAFLYTHTHTHTHPQTSGTIQLHSTILSSPLLDPRIALSYWIKTHIFYVNVL